MGRLCALEIIINTLGSANILLASFLRSLHTDINTNISREKSEQLSLWDGIFALLEPRVQQEIHGSVCAAAATDHLKYVMHCLSVLLLHSHQDTCGGGQRDQAVPESHRVK